MNTCKWPSADIDLLFFKTDLFTDREVVALDRDARLSGTDAPAVSR